jgi:hypothetical protein
MESFKAKRAKAKGRASAMAHASVCIAMSDKARKAVSDLKARNAYREACGLPILQASQK